MLSVEKHDEIHNDELGTEDHTMYIDQWNNRLDYLWQSEFVGVVNPAADYLPWYNQMTVRFLNNPVGHGYGSAEVANALV